MTNYERMKKLSEEAFNMRSESEVTKSVKFSAWYNRCELVLSRLYGENSFELKKFRKINFEPPFVTEKTTGTDFLNWQFKGLSEAEDLLDLLADDLPDETTGTKSGDEQDGDTVFIVHGHDGEFKYKTAALLSKIGLKYIILHEKGNLGNTIIEKLERCGKKARAAVVLFTPDDFGQAKTEEERQKRARQNVVFEAGYFIGRLGRNRVICVVSDKSVELPGDLSGVVYSDAHGDSDIVKELKAMGFEIDANRLFDN